MTRRRALAAGAGVAVLLVLARVPYVVDATELAIRTRFGRPVDLGWAEVRPFVEGRAGDESLLRAGVDLRFGQRERGALWLRDEITGQRYVGVSGSGGGAAGGIVRPPAYCWRITRIAGRPSMFAR